jgi:hypothetical protein
MNMKSPAQWSSKVSGTSTMQSNMIDSKVFSTPTTHQLVNSNQSPNYNGPIDNGKRQFSLALFII